MKDYEPDIFDLNDWLVLKHPEKYKTIKYLSGPLFYKIALMYWNQEGSPDISEIY